MGVAGRGQGALRVIEHNGAGAIGAVDDAARAWGLPLALPGHLRHVHTPLPEVSHQETWDGARAEGRARRHKLEPASGPDLPGGREVLEHAGAECPSCKRRPCSASSAMAAAAGEAQTVYKPVGVEDRAAAAGLVHDDCGDGDGACGLKDRVV